MCGFVLFLVCGGLLGFTEIRGCLSTYYHFNFWRWNRVRCDCCERRHFHTCKPPKWIDLIKPHRDTISQKRNGFRMKLDQIFDAMKCAKYTAIAVAQTALDHSPIWKVNFVICMLIDQPTTTNSNSTKKQKSNECNSSRHFVVIICAHFCSNFHSFTLSVFTNIFFSRHIDVSMAVR